MAQQLLKLSFTDGTEATVTRRPIHWMRAERVARPNAGAYETVLATAWAAVTGGTGGEAEFEAWAETVDSFEYVSVEADADPPGVEPAGSQS